jgi:hypothetical protein
MSSANCSSDADLKSGDVMEKIRARLEIDDSLVPHDRNQLMQSINMK